MTEVKKISLKSSDGELFEIDELVAMQSQTLQNMIEDDCANSTIPLPNVNEVILAKVIEYCQKHVEMAAAKPDGGQESADQALKEWDEKFVDVDQGTLYHLILASNYLNVKGLLDLTCQTVANMIKGKTPDQIRTLFDIKNDFTPEQEVEIRKENQWAFD